jgi:hypothetical protein
MKKTIELAILFLVLIGYCRYSLAQSNQVQARRTAIQSEWQAAVQGVQKIVNQPVRKLARTETMQVSTYGQGWFHNGALKPDFNNVDVRKTRETPYDSHQYVTSDLNPGFVFIGPELEFNPMTKAFFLDPTLPKKKLSEAEMLEINRLYRIIGRCEQQMAELQGK